MGDTEFEQFRRYFDRLPQYLKAPANSYTLVHDILLDESVTSPSGIVTSQDIKNENTTVENNIKINDRNHITLQLENIATSQDKTIDNDKSADGNVATSRDVRNTTISQGEDTGVSSASSSAGSEHSSLLNEEDDDGWRGEGWKGNVAPLTPHCAPPPWPSHGTRRRRKLPEIPKNKKSSVLSLADELGEVTSQLPEGVLIALRNSRQAVGNFQLRGSSGDTDGFSSPECYPSMDCSTGHQSLDADSGHSTVDSPDGSTPCAVRPASIASTCSMLSCSCSGVNLGAGGAACHDLSRLVATHRGLHKFVPRHRDEIEIEIGDPLYVQRECDDLWCEGVNMRSGRQGSFPSAYAVDLEYREFTPTVEDAPNESASRRERFLLDYVGSMESMHFKGTAVLIQAVRRVQVKPPPMRPVILEVSDLGLRMLAKDKLADSASAGKDLDYFYSLKNVSWCGFHPRDQRYFGFITKHPQRHRFACHLFRGDESMRTVAETIGRAFERFYQKFIETAYPTEDIYIE